MGRHLRWVSALFVLAPLGAQVDLGVTGGVPLTHFILDSAAGSRAGSSRVTSAPRRYTLGPSLELHLHGPLAIETGALYKRFGFDTAYTAGSPAGPITSLRSFTTGNSWEFPILAKVHLRLIRGLRGFLSAGPSIRRLTGVTETGRRTVQTLFPPPATTQITGYQTSSPSGMDRRTSIGAAAGVGMEFPAGPLRLSPEFRLTRWDTERTSSTSAASRLGRTQAEVLFTVAWAAGRREVPAARIPCCFELGLLAGVPFLAGSEFRSMPAPAGVTVTQDAPVHWYAAGALLDWRWRPHWSLEAGFLARRFGHAETRSFPGFSSTESISGYSWEAPLLLKRRFGRIRSAEFVLGAGPALRRASNIDWVFSSRSNDFQNRIKLDASFLSRSAFGAAVSGGLEIPAGSVRLRPELRYTWFQRPLYDLYTVATRQDSLVLLLAVSWIRRRY